MTKTALMTGAGSGIGQAAARILLTHGWRVALVGRRREPLAETAAGFETNTMLLVFDVSNPDAVAKNFQDLQARWGRLDLLFNNAGLGLTSTTPDNLAIEQWQHIVDVNLNGSFYCAREAFRIMRHQSPMGGRIINNGSISAHAPRPGSIAYTATKHAITGLTKSLSLDGRPFNIVASQIDIGNAITSMADSLMKGTLQANGDIKAEPGMDLRHVANLILQMAEMPLEANILTATIMASNMPFVGRG